MHAKSTRASWDERRSCGVLSERLTHLYRAPVCSLFNKIDIKSSFDTVVYITATQHKLHSPCRELRVWSYVRACHMPQLGSNAASL